MTDFDRVIIVENQARADVPAANGGNAMGFSPYNPFINDVNPFEQVQNA